MSNPQHEPTMEEILASIRKIISEDGPETAAAAPAEAAAPPSAAPAVHDDVLELTHEVEPPAQPAPQPAPAPAPLPAEDIVFENVAPAPAAHNDIFSDHTRRAVEDTFNSIPDE